MGLVAFLSKTDIPFVERARRLACYVASRGRKAVIGLPQSGLDGVRRLTSSVDRPSAASRGTMVRRPKDKAL